MRLVDLEPRLSRYAPEQRPDGLHHIFVHVEDLAAADCVWFLCPACFIANGGRVGTHAIRVDFRGRGVTDDVCMRNRDGVPVRWDVSGNLLADLSLTPSIQIEGGCAWHGYVTNGEIVGGI